MGPITAHREEAALVAERAADWLRRLETADGAERAEFMAWLKESPRNVREILLAATWDKALDGIDPRRELNIDALAAQGAADVVAFSRDKQSTARRAVNKNPRRWIAGLAAAAAVTGIAVWGSFAPFGHTYITEVGEQRVLNLADGSTIHLNAHSSVREDYSRGVRDVYLLEGQAIFKVAHDASRPFRVHVNGAFIQAVGTQFDVHKQSGGTTVTVIEGKVKVSTDPSNKILAAGEAASIAADGAVTAPKAINIAETTAWRQRRLVFRKQTLADMAVEFNRYNRALQIRVEYPALAARQFNGVFDADDPDALAELIGRESDVVVERRQDEIVFRPAAGDHLP